MDAVAFTISPPRFRWGWTASTASTSELCGVPKPASSSFVGFGAATVTSWTPRPPPRPGRASSGLLLFPLVGVEVLRHFYPHLLEVVDRAGVERCDRVLDVLGSDVRRGGMCPLEHVDVLVDRLGDLVEELAVGVGVHGEGVPRADGRDGLVLSLVGARLDLGLRVVGELLGDLRELLVGELHQHEVLARGQVLDLSLIHISEPTRRTPISY